MKSKLYLVTLLGEIGQTIKLCEQISMDGVKVVSDGDKLAIISFKSTVSSGEIKDFLAEKNLTVIVTQIGETGSVYLDDPHMANTLFGENANMFTGITVSDIIENYENEEIGNYNINHEEELVNILYEEVETFKDVYLEDMTSSEAADEIDRLLGNGKDITPEVKNIITLLSTRI